MCRRNAESLWRQGVDVIQIDIILVMLQRNLRQKNLTKLRKKKAKMAKTAGKKKTKVAAQNAQVRGKAADAGQAPEKIPTGGEKVGCSAWSAKACRSSFGFARRRRHPAFRRSSSGRRSSWSGFATSKARTHMADGYARATASRALVLVTSGPGATNTIHRAFTPRSWDSVPMVVITAQVVPVAPRQGCLSGS